MLQKESCLLLSMVLAVKQTWNLWSEAMHMRPGVRQFDGTVGDGYQRIPSIQLLGEYNPRVLAAESVADFVALVLVVVSARFAKP